MIESAVQAPPGVSGARAANDNTDSPWPIVTFSPAELAQLVRSEAISPSPASPITTLLHGHPGPPDDTRAVCARLEEKGLLRGAPYEPSSEMGAYLLLSLKAMARPQARLVVARYTPEGEPSVLPLFLSGELAVPAFIDDAGLHLGTPMERSLLCDTLEDQLAGEESSVTGDRLELPFSALETIEGLWCGAERAFDQAIPRDLALEVLAHLPEVEGEPRDQVEELLSCGLAVEASDGLRFSYDARPWMERVLSGHSCEVSLTPLEENPAVATRPLRLLFLGAAGQRVLCSGQDGFDDLESILLKGQDRAVVPGPWTTPPASSLEPTLTLSVLPHRVLRWYIRRLIQA